jgi:hypothetical protein
MRANPFASQDAGPGTRPPTPARGHTCKPTPHFHPARNPQPTAGQLCSAQSPKTLIHGRNPTFEGSTLAVQVWGLDLSVLLFSCASLALARSLATGTRQSSFSRFLNLRHRDAFALHPHILIPSCPKRRFSGMGCNWSSPFMTASTSRVGPYEPLRSLHEPARACTSPPAPASSAL